ncbi:MAG: hypothetical protein RJQ09_09855 [Cyclobacteriaceae bacterium]
MIDVRNDQHTEIARIQNEIENFLGLKSNQVIFEYSKTDRGMKVDFITINPRHNQSFLFRSEMGLDKIESLNKLLEYVKDYKEKEGSYTIQWSVRGDKELHTSYFWGSNIYDALDKLYYDRDIHTINVYSVTLNPIT